MRRRQALLIALVSAGLIGIGIGIGIVAVLIRARRQAHDAKMNAMKPEEAPFAGTFRDDTGGIVLDIARQRLQTQLSFAQAIEVKIGTIFATGGGLMGLLAAVFALQEGQLRLPTESAFGDPERAILVIALAAFGTVFIATSLAVLVVNWHIGPSVEEAFDDSQLLSKDQFIAKQYSGYVEEYESNSWKHTLKARALGVSQVAVGTEVACLATAAWRLVF